MASHELHLFRNDKSARAFGDGDVIFAQGDAADSLCVVVEGEVEIVRDGRVLATLHAGELFGEMGLIEREPRSATARAKGATKVVMIDERRFNFLVQQTPFFALTVMRVICRRLRPA